MQNTYDKPGFYSYHADFGSGFAVIRPKSTLSGAMDRADAVRKAEILAPFILAEFRTAKRVQVRYKNGIIAYADAAE